MIEVERNKPVDAEDLSEFFRRCGWEEPAAATKLEWAMAASDEWVVCRLEGELVGFARLCRLGPLDRVVFDALVDPRFKYSLLRAQMVALLAVTAGRFERVLVFGKPPELRVPPGATDAFGPLYIPPVSPEMYTGKPRPTTPESARRRPNRASASRS
jgi:hypothetical protein